MRQLKSPSSPEDYKYTDETSQSTSNDDIMRQTIILLYGCVHHQEQTKPFLTKLDKNRSGRNTRLLGSRTNRENCAGL